MLCLLSCASQPSIKQLRSTDNREVGAQYSEIAAFIKGEKKYQELSPEAQKLYIKSEKDIQIVKELLKSKKITGDQVMDYLLRNVDSDGKAQAKQHANTSSQLNQANGQGEKTYQTTEGDQSPVINAEGDVTLIYQGLPKVQREALFKQFGNSQQLVDRLLKELDAKDADLERHKAEIKKWVKEYEELKNKYAKLTEHDEQAIKTKAAVKAALIEGDLKKAKGGIIIGPGIRLGGGIRIQ